jgi:hypothetical protein
MSSQPAAAPQPGTESRTLPQSADARYADVLFAQRLRAALSAGAVPDHCQSNLSLRLVIADAPQAASS